ncbi:hypothetical protein MAH1_03740 [Sessilibacter sp. MAH1]
MKKIINNGPLRNEIKYFILAGASGFLVDTTILLILSQHLNPFISRLISFTAALVITWKINSKLTFKGRPNNFLKYMLGQNIGVLINYAIYTIAIYALGRKEIDLIYAMILSSTGAMFVNFALMKFWVFKKNKNPKKIEN